MPLSVYRFSITIGAAGRHGSARRRQWLLIAAVGHPDFVEHESAHQVRELLAGYIHHHQLLDGDSAAGVARLGSGNNVDANRIGVSRLLTVQDLYDRRHWSIDIVAGESVYREPRGM